VPDSGLLQMVRCVEPTFANATCRSPALLGSHAQKPNCTREHRRTAATPNPFLREGLIGYTFKGCPMSWWMYIAVVFAGLLGLGNFRSIRTRGWLQTMGAIALTVAVYKFWPTSSAPFWLSLLVIVASFVMFQIKERASKSTATEGTSGVDLRSQDERDIAGKAEKALSRDEEALAHKLCQLALQSTAYGDTADLEMKKIGKYLNEKGGYQLMQLVCYRVRSLGGKARSVESTWSGIGDWRG